MYIQQRFLISYFQITVHILINFGTKIQTHIGRYARIRRMSQNSAINNESSPQFTMGSRFLTFFLLSADSFRTTRTPFEKISKKLLTFEVNRAACLNCSFFFHILELEVQSNSELTLQFYFAHHRGKMWKNLTPRRRSKE